MKLGCIGSVLNVILFTASINDRSISVPKMKSGLDGDPVHLYDKFYSDIFGWDYALLHPSCSQYVANCTEFEPAACKMLILLKF